MRRQISKDYEDRQTDLKMLPTEMREAYLDVTRHHKKLLERLAQR